MRIAVVGPSGEGQIAPSLMSALRQEGHDAELVASDMSATGIRMLSGARRLRADVLPGRIAMRRWASRDAVRGADAILVVKGRFVSAGGVRMLRRRTDAVILNYFPDNPLFPAFYEPPLIEALRAYDLVCIWSEALAERLQGLSIPARVLPFGYDERLYNPDASTPVRWDACFVGQWSSLREHHIRSLRGLELVIAGSGWRARSRNLPPGCSVLEGTWFGHRAAALYRESRVGLNVMHPQNAGAHNMRTWELPATGTAAVMTDSAFHRTLFGANGARLFSDVAGLRSQALSLLADDSARRIVADAGRRAVSAGTYRSRMQQLVAWIHELRGDVVSE